MKENKNYLHICPLTQTALVLEIYPKDTHPKILKLHMNKVIPCGYCLFIVKNQKQSEYQSTGTGWMNRHEVGKYIDILQKEEFWFIKIDLFLGVLLA